jgi:hypothetical protein
LLLYSSYLSLGVPNWTVLFIINTVPHQTVAGSVGPIGVRYQVWVDKASDGALLAAHSDGSVWLGIG